MAEPLSEESIGHLRTRADRLFGNRTVLESLPKQLDIVGPPRQQLTRLAQQGRDKLLGGQAPTPAELDALELCIRRLRPALLAEDGAVRSTAQFALPSTIGQSLRSILPAVAALTDAQENVVGTGFLVADRRIMTNSHVVFDLDIGRSVAQFRREATERIGHPQATVTECVFQSAELDIAILAIEPEAPISAKPLPLASRAKQKEGQPIWTIGYPVRDPVCPLLADEVFEGLYTILRVSPGEVLGASPRLIFHDCSTLQGSSGSPIWDMSVNAVVGVHQSGTFAYRNEAIPTSALAADSDLHGIVKRWL